MNFCQNAVMSQQITRRESLGRLTAGSLLALGLWPGRIGGADSSASFRFLVVNDTHYLTAECGVWLEGVVGQMKKENAEFCLHAGDLVDNGHREGLGAVSEIFKGLGVSFYPVIGNHDYLSSTDRTGYESIFPKKLNYAWTHEDWQFVALDSSEGLRYEKTSIQPATFQWLDDNLSKLEAKRPTVIVTHFPLGEGVTYRPLNSDWLLDRFRDFNLKAVFSGHYHGFTEREAGRTVLTTNRCCALKRDNHDGTKEKGYFVCDVRNGRLERRFAEYKA
jgi:predicted phosphodiesterase